MGLFFYTKKGSIISTVDLPTTEIIEPEKAEQRVQLDFLAFLPKFIWKMRSVLAESTVWFTGARL